MEHPTISHAKVPRAGRLFLDYVHDFRRVSSFYSHAPFQAQSYRDVAGRLHFPETYRRRLVEVLEAQNREFGCGEAVLAHLKRLAEPNTCAVVTGQQIGLFSGPAFALYKALTTVRLAGHLNENGVPSIPIFWAATEDHDFEEVASCTVLDDSYQEVVLRLGGERPAPQSSVGRIKVSQDVTGALEQLRERMPAGPGLDALVRDLEECYRPGTGWGKAFCRFLSRLFARWGVVLVDPLDPALQELAGEVYQRASENPARLRAQLQQRSALLVRRGYHAQVHVQDDSTLLFAHVDGNRLPVRHKPDNTFFLDGDRSVRPDDLRGQITAAPQDFSPNVLLRPLVQDWLLPTVAYVAGPSELAYLGQAQVLYEDFERTQPVIFPRAAFTLVDRRSSRLMEKYGLQIEDVWKGEEHLGARLAASGVEPGWNDRFEEKKQAVRNVLEELRGDVERIDPTLVGALATVQEKMVYQLDRFQGKLSRSTLQRSEKLANAAQRLRQLLFPRKNLQERVISGAYFLGRADYDLLENLYRQVQVQSSEHQVIEI